MTTPPLLIAATVAFWGMESGNLIVGLALAGLIAGVNIFSLRWSMTDEDFIRVSDLTSVIFLTAAALILLNVEKLIFLKTLVIWQPPVLLPLVLAQLCSGRDKIIIGTKLGFGRKKIYKHEPLDFRIYYLAVCLISAAMANSRSLLFFPGAGLLFFWWLLANRGRSFSHAAFVLVFLLAVAGGFGVFKGAELAHEYVREKARLFMRGYYSSRYADPFQTNLSFGTFGRLKTSGAIILRVESGKPPPSLLRLASYEIFDRYSWYSNQSFSYLPVKDMAWSLLPRPDGPGRQATIEYYLPKEKGLLPHPYGSFQVAGETIYELEQKDDGITRIVDGAPLITYEVRYDPALGRKTDPPTRRNLLIPHEEEEVLDMVVADWQRAGLTSEEKVERIRGFFAAGFTYSLTMSGKGQYASPLANFLLGTRSGYCEQYATATALLLRKMGIASRYVTGFAVSERSTLEEKYIVRERHAHAWSEAYVNGQWLVVDTTPPDWLALESRNRSSFEWLSDLIAYVKLQFDHFRIQTEQNYRLVLSLVVVVLAAVLIYRIYRRMTAQKIADESLRHMKLFSPADSPLYRVERQLLETGVPRQVHEPFLFWAKRINEVKDIDLATLERLFTLHLKLRFDPAGLAGKEMRIFEEQAEQWLADYAKAVPAEQGGG